VVAHIVDDLGRIDSVSVAMVLFVFLKFVLISFLEIFDSMTIFLFFNWIILSIMYYSENGDGYYI
jgi:hypothetical protein